MNDDYQLFSDADSSDSFDPDIALITAYLAREMSLVQFAAVEQRLASDHEFREKVNPIIEGWTIPRSFDQGVNAILPQRTQPSSLSAAQIDAGWQRVAASGDARLLRQPSDTIATTAPVRRTRSVFRIAATIAIIVLPASLFAQFIIQAIRSNEPARGSASQSDISTPSSASGTTGAEYQSVNLRDGPVQIPLAPDSRLTPSQPGVRTVDVSAPSAETKLTFGAVLGVKEMSDGSLLVNDATRRLLHLFAADLASSTVALDSARGSARSYQIPRLANYFPLISFLGDSTLLPEAGAGASMRVIDGKGEVVRSLALAGSPRESLLPMSRPTYVDAKGNVLFKGDWPGSATIDVPASASTREVRGNAIVTGGGGGGRGGAANGPQMLSVAIHDREDSLPILRMEVEARRVDTAGRVQMRRALQVLTQLGKTNASLRQKGLFDGSGKPVGLVVVINALMTADEWAVLSDGTLALVRGSDYHVDWIHPDGRKSASPKLPYDWKRLTDADKQNLVDSLRTAWDSLDACARRRIQGKATPADGILSRADSARIATARGVPANQAPSRCPTREREWPWEFAPISEMADYYPPFNSGAAIPDRDGNLWILPRTTTVSRQGELVYDVVNPRQGFVQRVRLPLGRSIAGFGKGGVVYLQVGSIKNGFTIERVSVAR